MTVRNEQDSEKTRMVGNSNTMGDESSAQIIKAEGGSTIQNVIQAVIHLPPRAWIGGISILALTVLLVAGILNIGPLQGLLPTPTAFAPASEDEALIIVAEFDNRSEGELVGVDPSSPIYDFVLRAAQDNPESNVRVERFEQVVTNSRDAQTLGERYEANLVIWGWYNSLGAQPYVELIGERTIQGEGIALETPTPMAFYFLNDIPSQSAYLGLFTMGMTHIVVESSAELRQAIAFFDAAVSSVVEGTRVKPWEAYVWRANCYAWLGEYEIALQDYDRALYLNPEDAPGYFNRGVAHFNLGDYEAAIADYTEAICIRPDYAMAYFGRAVAHSNLGDHEAAITDYTKAIELGSCDYCTYLKRGQAHYELGNYELAIADYTRALELNPEDAFAQWEIGRVYGAQSEYEKAIQAYTHAIEIDSQFVHAYLNRGGNYSDMGEYQLALQDYARVIELDPQNALVYMYRGITYKRLGDVDKAIADFEHHLELSTDPDWRKWTEEQLRGLRGE